MTEPITAEPPKGMGAEAHGGPVAWRAGRAMGYRPWARGMGMDMAHHRIGAGLASTLWPARAQIMELVIWRG